jgi:putative peptide zinc metalloprotease protein
MAEFFSPNWYRVAALKPQLNAGVRVARHRYRGESWYVLLDPASGKSHRVTPQTQSLIAQMDGQHALDAIWLAALERLGDDAPTQDEMIALLGQLHTADILQFDVSPDSAELFESCSTATTAPSATASSRAFAARWRCACRCGIPIASWHARCR